MNIPSDVRDGSSAAAPGRHPLHEERQSCPNSRITSTSTPDGTPKGTDMGMDMGTGTR
ncbi:hypothetical protein GCM10010176_037150 [Nonomuraea spiralis]|nr:hypothetical protein GCM10010176_037150 [Nonomuraea spiralis]